MRLKAVLVLAALAFFSLPAMAQTTDMEASADFTGNIQKSASGQGTTDTATKSGGVLINVRRHFNFLPRKDELEVNGGFTTFTQYYSPAGSQTQSNVWEGSVAYVHRFGDPNSESHWRPFVEGGAAVELFSVVSSGSVAGSQNDFPPAVLYGAGVDWHRSTHFGLRLGYRGLFYRAPDFSLPNQITSTWTHMAEPYFGLTYRF